MSLNRGSITILPHLAAGVCGVCVVIGSGLDVSQLGEWLRVSVEEQLSN